MDDSVAVSDSTDWLQTVTPQLAQFEAALRCQVCKDFYDTPMITSCSHTFCSLCIRRCLTTDGKCPLCRAPDQELRLRRNCTVEELVEVFQTARPALILLGKPHLPSPLEILNGTGKRSLDDSLGDQVKELGLPETRRRKLRSHNERLPSVISNFVEGDQVIKYQQDGLTACPICNQRMKEQDVFLHLDVHNSTDDKPHVESSVPSLTYSDDAISKGSQPATKSPDRLPQLNYSLLKDNALRRKLVELGIPPGGPRSLLIRRHTEWVNMVNANRDSSRPRTKREMLQELEVWDRTQGRQISRVSGESSSANLIMSKEFDGTAWGLCHNNDFQQLISNARRKLGKSDTKEVNDNIQSSLNPSQDLTDESTNLEQIEQQGGQPDVGRPRTPTNRDLLNPDHDEEGGASTHPKTTTLVIDLEAGD